MELLYGQAQQGGGLAAFLPFILIMFIIYFLMIRPQTKRQKEKQTKSVLGNIEVLLFSAEIGHITTLGQL